MVKPGYKQTEIGVIPEDWEIKYLSDFGKIQSGGTPSTTMAEYWGGNIAWCTPSDITSTPTKYINATERAITDLGLKNSAATVMPAGSILLCTRATIGELKINSIPMATNQGFKHIAINKGGNVDFLYYLLQTKKDCMLELAIGSTFLEISKTALCKIPLQTPMQSNEQSKIADALSDIDSLVEVLENQISKKKAIKQGAMQELLTGKRRLPGFFGEWVNTKIGSITEVYSGGTPNTSEPAFWGGKIPWMNSGELNLKIVRQVQGRITEVGMDSSSTHFIPAECVLIGLAGQGKTRGTAAFNTFPLCTNQSIAAIYPNPNKFDSKFLYYKMDTQYDQLRELSSGDGGRGGLNKKLILDYEVVIPQSIDEQAAIATILTEMDYEIENLEMKLTKYRQVKQGMMQQLLTGKIRLKNDVEDLRQAEQANAVKTLPARTAHNRQFDDAVSIAAIVDVFYSDKYPLGRVKVQKLLYLLHRHQAVSVSDFKKKAAGPYADTVRYKGGEPIAKKNKYIVSENGKQGTRYSRGENMAQALNYVERWGMRSDLQWLKENFLHTGRNDLELFATVDMAICDLNEAGVPISVASIKDLIASSKEWKAKLSKTYFSDRDIARAVKKCTELFN